METLNTVVMYAVPWFGLVAVNTLVGAKKGCNAAVVTFLSIVAAPIVYLYVLALPPKS